jgi:L-amino acid N-acyltransferase YncA
VDDLIRPVADRDARAVVDIFNHYAQNTMAAYFEDRVPVSFFPVLQKTSAGRPFLVAERDGEVIGFALLRPYHQSPVFGRTAEVTYFLAPGHQGRGLGTRMLEALEREAGRAGVDNLLASISSENEVSQAFHQRRGFVECGRFDRVGHKLGRDFSVVYMQKRLDGV